MCESYFLITSGEDGIYITECENQKKLKEYIQPDKDGECYYGELEFLDKIPIIDKGYFDTCGNPAIIIKGKIIIPRPVNVVTEYEID